MKHYCKSEMRLCIFSVSLCFNAVRFCLYKKSAKPKATFRNKMVKSILCLASCDIMRWIYAK